MSDAFLSYHETIDAVRDFLEVAFHTILYIRQVYPLGKCHLFEQVRKYGVTTWQCRNPLVSEYIGKIVSCIREELHKGTVRRVFLAIREDNPEATPLERFVFDIESLLLQSDLAQDGSDFVPRANGILPGDVEALLRACMIKLNVSTSYLSPIPPETALTFAVLLEVKDGSAPPASKAAKAGSVPAEWIPADQRDAMEDNGTGTGRGHTAARAQSTISPVTGVRLGMFNLDLQVEELAEKFGTDLPDDAATDSSGHFPRRDRKGKGRA
ncbi:hypothetical protein BMF94_2892 [Rhodotorula taiwanensis]|uniref:HORMA domain-containing protein n=1 Tax=Rhodotorula taiwanensis TaxID=741276 RepID=A0A2S5BBD5_9BASI|nr:hypothetical protein BMF94_2892 [Rhodotorula taiwanensis]